MNILRQWQEWIEIDLITYWVLIIYAQNYWVCISSVNGLHQRTLQLPEMETRSIYHIFESILVLLFIVISSLLIFLVEN